MRKLVITAAAMFLLAGSAGPLAAKEEESFEAKCRKWAAEDGVPKEELADYLKQCIEDLKNQAPEGESVKGQKGED